MSDVWHQWGGDLALTATGDLQTTAGTEYGQHRLLRRLLTNPGDYIWHLDYGAGLPRRVGEPVNERLIAGVIRGQVLREAAVAASPEPTIDVRAIPTGVYAHILYADAPSGGMPQSLSFSVDR